MPAFKRHHHACGVKGLGTFRPCTNCGDTFEQTTIRRLLCEECWVGVEHFDFKGEVQRCAFRLLSEHTRKTVESIVESTVRDALYRILEPRVSEYVDSVLCSAFEIKTCGVEHNGHSGRHDEGGEPST